MLIVQWMCVPFLVGFGPLNGFLLVSLSRKQSCRQVKGPSETKSCMWGFEHAASLLWLIAWMYPTANHGGVPFGFPLEPPKNGVP